MHLGPESLGWVVTLKVLLHGATSATAIAVALTSPENFSSMAGFSELVALVVAASALLEWIFRRWHQEQVDKVKSSAAAHRQGRQEVIDWLRGNGFHVTAGVDGGAISQVQLRKATDE